MTVVPEFDKSFLHHIICQVNITRFVVDVVAQCFGIGSENSLKIIGFANRFFLYQEAVNWLKIRGVFSVKSSEFKAIEIC